MDKFKSMSLVDFAAAAASAAPTPGGGGASALAGALGASLGAMVGNITKDKKSYARFSEENARLALEMEELSQRLISAVDGDAEAFEPLSRAYAMPKDDPSRPVVMEKALRDAAQAPYEILELCCRAVEVHEKLARTGSRLALPDVAAGMALCRGAMYGAAINVRANTHLMKDADYARDLTERVDALLEKYGGIAGRVFDEIYGGLK